jgi:p-aminobenzoyl-glutamate transporter AbgT
MYVCMMYVYKYSARAPAWLLFRVLPYYVCMYIGIPHLTIIYMYVGIPLGHQYGFCFVPYPSYLPGEVCM